MILKLLKYLSLLLFNPIWYLQLLIPRNKNIWIFGAWFGENNRLIYNYKKDGKLGSKIFNLDNSHSCFINFPIDTVSNDGQFATSFSYSRLNKFMPGYGYIDLKTEKLEEGSIPKENGLFLLDESGDCLDGQNIIIRKIL